MNETICQKALRLLSAVPAEEFITSDFTDEQGKCCAIGHFARLTSGNPQDYSYQNCCDEDETFRDATARFLVERHKEYNRNIASVNNYPTVNGYTDPDIKTRVIKCLEDAVKAGY
jgi:hypothetical protein